MKIGLPREYFEGLASETGDLIQNGDRSCSRSWAARCARSACRTTKYAVRLLLHHRDGRGQLEPGAL